MSPQLLALINIWLLVQASLARAEIAAQEAGHLGRLRADLQASAQKRAQQLHASLNRLATQISQRVERRMQEWVSQRR